jgi:hypothetical protein
LSTDIERRMSAALDDQGSQSRRVDGVGAIIAVRLIGRTGPASRFPTAGAFATYAGVAPIEVAAGERTRHRLSRAGDRQLNSAIHLVAVTQVRMRPSVGRRYHETKIAEGKTRSEAMRALKRRLDIPRAVGVQRRRQGPPHHRIVSRAVVVATAVTASGDREVLGVDVGDSEDEVFWPAFLAQPARPRAARRAPRDLRRPRRPQGVDRPCVHRGQLATPQGPPDAQPARTVPAASKDMVAATVRTIFAQPDAATTRSQLHDVVGLLEERFPKAAELLAAAEGDVCACAAFPRARWRKIASTNPLERVNTEIKRRSNVVGIFPDDAS